MIYITGDTHGEQGRFVYSEEEKTWTESDHIIVCGDFGFLFRNKRAENLFLDDLEKRPYTLCFVDGNHENFPAIFSYPKEKWNGGYIHRIRKNVIHLMRGQVFTIEGKKIFTMGGAYSMDRCMRILGQSYWNEELPSDAEYKEAISNLRENDFTVDYIIAHTAPREIIRRMGNYPDAHDMELTCFLEYCMHEVAHRHFYCGHWHMDKKITDKFTALWFDIVKAE